MEENLIVNSINNGGFMKKILIFILLTLSMIAQTITGKVTSITDGDTIKVLENKAEYKIRFNGIDAPEKSQAYGQKSKEFLSSLIFGKEVIVEVKDKDKYGRYVSDIFLGNKYINAEMVENGFAWHYKEYSKDKSLAELEDKARMNKVGLWADSNPISPWDFRHGTSTVKTNITESYSNIKQNEDVKENVVYITKTGKKYHRDGCSSLSKSKIEISREVAEAKGYSPCSICNP